MSEKALGVIATVGIVAGIGYIILNTIKKKSDGEPLIAPITPDIAQLYDDALKDIQDRHLTDNNVIDTLKKVADDIKAKAGDTSLPLKGVIIVVDEVRDVVKEQLDKISGGGGSGGDYLFT